MYDGFYLLNTLYKIKMQLPKEILEKAISLAENFSKKELSQKFKEVSERYRGEKIGKSLLNRDEEATAYALSRMPATYAAVFSAMLQTLATITKEIELKTLLDIGAGTGAATLAVAEQISVEKIICLEREDAMINLGKNLFSSSNKKVVQEAEWKKLDLMQDEVLETADIVVVSYMLNELDEMSRLQLVEKLWKQTNQILLIVEPGTPKDFQNMMRIKNFLIEKEAKIIAPCSQEKGCALPKEDWCHFLCRVERTKWQKDIKDASVPYEDEKFTYLAFSKQEIGKTNHRVIRPPVFKTNFIEVKMCEEDKIVERTITKKEKEFYKKAKKVRVGECLVGEIKEE